MLSGPPELRRNYLDGILELIKPGFQKTRREYMRTLRQRNILLRKGKVSSAELFPWNVRLSHLGGEIARLRAELTLGLNKKVKNVYSALSGTAAKIDLIYKSGVEIGSYENHLLKKLESDLEIDLMRGFTGSGPHREDLEVLINQKTPSAAASRGEARMLVIALKILEVDKLEQCLDKRAIILMDDVFGELDRERSTTLTRYLSGHQSLITTTESSLKNDSSSNIITS
jgi:DNA replication and repair protein RecF